MRIQDVSKHNENATVGLAIHYDKEFECINNLTVKQMRKIKILTIGTIAVILGIIACKKEVELQTQTKDSGFDYQVSSNIPYSQIKTINKGFKGTKGSDIMLCFPDMETFRFVMNELKRQTTEYDSAFMAKFNNLGIDAINEKVEEIGYDEEKPLFNFAEYFKFYNLHRQIAEQETEYLKQEELNIENDPDNHFIIEDEVRALLNSDCEVKINDTIYKLTEEGYFAICDGNLKSLQKIGEKKGGNISIPNVIFVEGKTDTKADGCNSDQRNADKKESGKYQIKWVVSHWTHPWDRRVTAKIDNYYKKGAFLNTWVKQKAVSYCKVYGYISGTDGNCDTQVNFNPSNIGLNSGSAVESWEHTIFVSTKTKSGWVKAYFSGINGITHERTLTW